MRNTVQGILLLAGVALAAACGGAPEVDQGMRDPVSAATQAATNYWEEGSYTLPDPQWVACRNEWVSITGTIYYRYHEVDTANGWAFDYFVLPATPNRPVFLTGLTSGTVFNAIGGPVPTVFHSNFASGAESRTRTFVDNELYRSDSGEVLWWRAFRHLTRTPSGQVMVNSSPGEFICP
jgi:hypothetical protein